MLRERLIQLVMLIVAGAALTGAAMLTGPVESQRSRLKLTTVTAEENIGSDPKTTLLQVAPGGLRAPLLTYLWLRSQQLKEDGKFFDARQQRDLICDMMPHFPGVWSFHAWDMAWNISVATHTPEERWMWVSNGIRLLRDRGLYYNPDNLILHKELAWIFFSKMGQYADDMHMTYKRRWAGEMHSVLGAPPFADSPDAAIEAFRRVAESPESLAKLRTDAAAADFAERIGHSGIKLDEVFLQHYNRYSGDPSVSSPEWMAKEPTDEKDRQIAHLMRSEEFASERAKVLAFVRRKTLVEQYRLDPNWMLELMERYGPMDWRNVNSHALYWATLGLHRSEGKKLSEINLLSEINDLSKINDLSEFNNLNTGRIYLDALKALVQTGQVYYTPNPNNPEEPYVDFGPDWRFVESTHAEYLVAERVLVRKPTGEPDELDSPDNLLRDGHITYLSNVVQQMYFGGREDLARKYYDEIKNTLKATGDVYALGLQGFVAEKRRQTGVPTGDMSKALLTGALRSAYRALAGGNQSDYLRNREAAIRAYSEYLKDVAGKPRLEPPPFETVERNFLATMLIQPQAIGLNVPLIVKANIYNALTISTRKEIFPVIVDRLRRQCQDEGFDFNKAFPAPP